MVTASHNPPEYNGFKVVDSDGIEITSAMEEKWELLIHRVTSPATYTPGQRTSREGEIRSYLHEVEKHVDHHDRFRDLKIVIDACNGVAAQTTPTLLRHLGARVISVNDVIDGDFPGRNSEPRHENLGALSRTVREEKADLGIAHDGDGDRAIFVDERGEVQPGDRTLALIEEEVVRTHHDAKVVRRIKV